MSLQEIVLLIITVTWPICGFLTYGICLAYFQKKFPTLAYETYEEDCGLSLFFALTGHIGLIATYLMSGFAEHGLMFKRETIG